MANKISKKMSKKLRKRFLIPSPQPVNQRYLHYSCIFSFNFFGSNKNLCIFAIRIKPKAKLEAKLKTKIWK